MQANKIYKNLKHSVMLQQLNVMENIHNSFVVRWFSCNSNHNELISFCRWKINQFSETGSAGVWCSSQQNWKGIIKVQMCFVKYQFKTALTPTAGGFIPSWISLKTLKLSSEQGWLLYKWKQHEKAFNAASGILLRYRYQ